VFLPQQSGYTHAFSGLITNLLQAGFSVDVLTPEQLTDGIDEPLQHHQLTVTRYNPKLNIWAVGLFYRFKKLAQQLVHMYKSKAYHLVLIETGDEPLLLYYLPNYILQKTAVRFHSTSDTEYLNLSNQKKYKLRKWFWKYLSGGRVKHLCATNAYHLNYAAQQVLHNTTIQSQHIITNTINVQTLETKPQNGVQFFMLGRMDTEGYKQKGFDTLLQALPLVAQHMQKSNATITIVGNGNCFDTFKSKIANYPFVKLIPSLTHQQTLNYLQQTDVVLLPSLYEGVSMFALEALATGNAVVYSNTGGLIDMVDGNGYLIEPANYSNLADAIVTLINTPDLAKLKQQSIEIALKKYHPQIQLNQFNLLMEEVQT
jgi:glycosyltransferase involved in cell wall biosynthesis